MNTTHTERKDAASLDDASAGGNDDHQQERATDANSTATPKPKDDADGPPHIPAPVWGHVLDYMPCQEVGSALFIGKIIANDAVKHLHTLSFTKSNQLDGPSCRRFSNVEDVNILCFVENGDRNALCATTSRRMVPVLINFPKLKRIFAGGFRLVRLLRNELRNERIDVHSRIVYRPPPEAPETNRRKQNDIFKGLMKSLSGAFQARMLSSSLELEGFDEGFVGFWDDLCEDQDENGGACDFCRSLISTLPLNFLVDRSDTIAHCICDEEYYRFFRKRANAKKAMDDASTEKLVSTLIYGDGGESPIRYLHLDEENEDDEDESKLAVKLQGMGVTNVTKVQYLDEIGMKELDRVISYGFDPKAMSKADLYGEFCIGQDDREYDVFAKCTFDALVSRGFAFDAKDLIVLDERSEPGLKRLPALIRRTGNDSE